MVTVDAEVVVTARRLANEVLRPAAQAVERSGEIPRSHFDALAAVGLYGLVAPATLGGWEADEPTRLAVVEALASGCLTTTFVWAQHHGAMAAATRAASEGPRLDLARQLCHGEVRAGAAFAGLRRPGPAVMRAERGPSGWSLTGTAPWVSGWGLVDLLHVAARDVTTGDLVWGLVEAHASSTLRAEPLELVAVQASRTVTLELSGHHLHDEQVTFLEPFDDWVARDQAGLRMNGALSLGVAAQCNELLGGAFADELTEARRELERAPVREVPTVRARAATLAHRAAAALVVSNGGQSVLAGHEASRLARESLFLLVFGQTAAIRQAELDQLGAAGT